MDAVSKKHEKCVARCLQSSEIKLLFILAPPTSVDCHTGSCVPRVPSAFQTRHRARQGILVEIKAQSVCVFGKFCVKVGKDKINAGWFEDLRISVRSVVEDRLCAGLLGISSRLAWREHTPDRIKRDRAP